MKSQSIRWPVIWQLGACVLFLSTPSTTTGQDRFDQFPFFDMIQRAADGGSPFELTPDQMREIEAIEIPIAQESKLGKRLVRNYEDQLARSNEAIIRDGPRVDDLSGLVAKIRPLMTHAKRYRKIQVNLVQSDRFDARMFPGGTMYVFTGLLEKIDNEAMLVAVLGHELSHLDHGHQLFELRRNRMIRSGQPFASQDFREMMANFSMVASSFARPFRPEEEATADADGVRWAWQLGYDPRELPKLFRKLADQFGNEKDNRWNYFRSHPGNELRHLATRRLADSLVKSNPNKPLVIGPFDAR